MRFEIKYRNDSTLYTIEADSIKVGAQISGGASYGEGVPLTQIPVQILGLTWPVYIFDSHLKIGCEIHTFAEWEKFTDSQIKKMDSQALPWWKIHKAPIIAMIKAVRP